MICQEYLAAGIGEERPGCSGFELPWGQMRGEIKIHPRSEDIQKHEIHETHINWICFTCSQYSYSKIQIHQNRKQHLQYIQTSHQLPPQNMFIQTYVEKQETKSK